MLRLLKRIEGIKSAKLKTGNWIFDINFLRYQIQNKDKQLDFH